MPHAILLGNAQDAGVPQAGCLCPNCRAAWASASQRKWVSALGLLDAETGQWFLIDATPDFREQLRFMQTRAPAASLSGLLLTHAHIGHYTGLIHLGYEAMAARGLPVYGTARLNGFLSAHAPWSQLVRQGNIVLYDLMPESWFALTPNLSVKPLLVPHRDEWSDAVAFIVRGPARRLLYLPDIDAWERWELSLNEVVAEVDVALLDGSFFSADELPGRDVASIGHPLVSETVARLKGSSADVRFIHLNHSNPLHRAGPEREWLEAQAMKVGEAGDEWEL
ncbi:MAG: MBL fold metallo-hydrolase [Anaerolineales bacterium]